MAEYLEFKDEEIPKKNPNAKKDIYRISGTPDADGTLIIGVIVAIAIIILGIYCRKDMLAFGLCIFIGALWFYICMGLLYSKHCMRKKIIAEGKAYPAVVIRSFDYIKRKGTTHASTFKNTEYGIEVKYAKGTREFRGYDGDAGKYLENPYCTVYEWNNRTIVADFKVRDEYISADGKSYSLKPVKCKKR